MLYLSGISEYVIVENRDKIEDIIKPTLSSLRDRLLKERVYMAYQERRSKDPQMGIIKITVR